MERPGAGGTASVLGERFRACILVSEASWTFKLPQIVVALDHWPSISIDCNAECADSATKGRPGYVDPARKAVGELERLRTLHNAAKDPMTLS